MCLHVLLCVLQHNSQPMCFILTTMARRGECTVVALDLDRSAICVHHLASEGGYATRQVAPLSKVRLPTKKRWLFLTKVPSACTRRAPSDGIWGLSKSQPIVRRISFDIGDCSAVVLESVGWKTCKTFTLCSYRYFIPPCIPLMLGPLPVCDFSSPLFVSLHSSCSHR